jgi:hypothetical protein
MHSTHLPCSAAVVPPAGAVTLKYVPPLYLLKFAGMLPMLTRTAGGSPAHSGHSAVLQSCRGYRNQVYKQLHTM